MTDSTLAILAVGASSPTSIFWELQSLREGCGATSVPVHLASSLPLDDELCDSSLVSILRTASDPRCSIVVTLSAKNAAGSRAPTLHCLHASISSVATIAEAVRVPLNSVLYDTLERVGEEDAASIIERIDDSASFESFVAIITHAVALNKFTTCTSHERVRNAVFARVQSTKVHSLSALLDALMPLFEHQCLTEVDRQVLLWCMNGLFASEDEGLPLDALCAYSTAPNGGAGCLTPFVETTTAHQFYRMVLSSWHSEEDMFKFPVVTLATLRLVEGLWTLNSAIAFHFVFCCVLFSNGTVSVGAAMEAIGVPSSCSPQTLLGVSACLPELAAALLRDDWYLQTQHLLRWTSCKEPRASWQQWTASQPRP